MAPSIMKIPFGRVSVLSMDRRGQKLLTAPAIESPFALKKGENISKDTREAAGDDGQNPKCTEATRS